MLTHCIFKIKLPGAVGTEDQFMYTEPVVGKWYCAFEVRKHTDGTPYHRDGSIGEYTGDGCFVDEDGEYLEMTNDYIVEQI